LSFRVVDIDHLMIRVADLDSGVETFRRLGFTVAPPRRELELRQLEEGTGDGAAAPSDGGPKSTINHRHILFQPYPGRDDVANFLELMSIDDQLATPPRVTQMLCFLLDSEGPKTVVCMSDDIDRAREEILADGIDTSPPIPLETGWEDEERGRFVRVSGRPIVPVYGQTPFMTNTCIHNVVESMRYEPWTSHENGARYLAGVTGLTEDIREHTRLMAERVYDVEPEWVSDDIAVIRPRDIFFRIVTPAGFGELYPGLDFSRERIPPALCAATIAVDSLHKVQSTLRERGVDHVDTPAGVAVPRQEAANTVIEFVTADESARP
jgi:hypothetical protein